MFYEMLDGFISSGTPSFNFIYYHRPGHSPWDITSIPSSKANRILSFFRNSYVNTIRKENNKFIRFFESIIEKDKNSLIIVIGDHGSSGYRTGEDVNGNRISYPLITLDRFGVLAGIYGQSESVPSLLNNGTIKSHVNLFKYIFAFLCEDDKVLETLSHDDSFDGPLRMSIKDNRILEKPEKITLKNSKR